MSRTHLNLQKQLMPRKRALAVPCVLVALLSGQSFGQERPQSSAASVNLAVPCKLAYSASLALFCNTITFINESNHIDNAASFSFHRQTNYNGGTAGFENAALRIINENSVGNSNNEDGLLSILRNHSQTPAENASGRFQANQFGSSPVWSLANEVIDHTGTVNPAQGLVGLEQVIAANGDDAHDNRIGIDLIAARPQIAGKFSGPDVTIGTGLRLVRQNRDPDLNNRYHVGISFGAPGAITDFDYALDFRYASFTTGGNPIRLGTGQKLAFDNNSSRTLQYSSGLKYAVAGADVDIFQDNGAIVAGTPQSRGAMLVLSNASGTCRFTPTSSAGGFVCSSDAKLKSNIHDASLQNDWLSSFRIRNYDLKSTGEHLTGVIAQELQRQHPEMVHEDQNGVLSVETPSPWMLIMSLQDMERRNDFMQAEIWVLLSLMIGLILFNIMKIYRREQR
jgi:hypothetical protein